MISKSVLRLSAAVLALATVPLSGARAQNLDRITSSLTDTLQTAIDLLPEDVTNIRLGLGPVVGPTYEGSNDYKVNPVPVVSLRYRNLIEVDNNEVKLIAFNRLFGAGTSTASGGVLKAGPLVSINFGRKESYSPDLRGMGNVGTSFELGGFVSYAFNANTRVRLRARQDVVSGHRGATVSADATQAFIRGANFALGGVVSGTWATARYMRSFFGVSPAQAAASGYPVFSISSGFKDVEVGLNGNYRVTDRWALVANVSFECLIGDAANSPIVRLKGSANQVNLSTFVVYSF